MSESFEIPFKSDVVPNMLTADASIKFRCHTGISCFNACCKRADITLTPYDIIRLKKRLDVTSGEFLKAHTVPFEMDADKVPGVKMRTDDEGACLFMTEEGCSVYEDRPTSCRYYPLGHLAMRHKDMSEDEQGFVLIEENHCKGHKEDRDIQIKDYLSEQDIPMFREMNREWMQLILKKKSGGPSVGKPPESSLQLYFMACFDVDRFRRFVMSDAFRKSYDLGDSTYETLQQDDIALMKFGFSLMRQVLFGERAIPEKPGVWEERMKERQEVWEARKQVELARYKEQEDSKYRDDEKK